MAAEQDWCLQCGSGAPGSLGTPSWRSAGIIIGVALALVLGAAAAGYAAFSRSTPKPRVATTTIARTVTPAPAVPAPSTTPLPTTSTPLPKVTVKPPKIPLTAVTPKATTETTTPTTTTTTTTTTPSSATTGGASSEQAPTAILLDTDAASTYNPYDYPASNFGDPSLAIDGDTSTGWTAQVEPATAPRMAEGLLINLKAPQRLSALELITSTPGMTVQVYGANGKTVPSSITEPAWVPLSHWLKVKKKHAHITLRESAHAFTFVTLWISRAPASSVGTAQAPGHVTVNELELFPAS